MKWTAEAKRLPGPRYLAVADAVTRAIDRGELANGARLPTHRDLARILSIDVTTVTRAYGELQRRGLAEGRVGQGTFVLASPPDSPASPALQQSDVGFIDLSHNFPTSAPVVPDLSELALEASREIDFGTLLGRQSDIGIPSHRAAGAAYLQTLGVDATGEDVVVSAGAQHALMLALAALTQPGDTILTEAMTFYGMKSAAALLGRQLCGVLMDNEGLVPEALESACAATGARVLYCTPTLHNPTTALMSSARRKAIAHICAKHRISVIEDDVYGFLPVRRQRPLWHDLKQQCIYLTSLSKSCGPGLRVGYMCVPELWRRIVGAAMRATTLMAAPIEAEIATRLIRTGHITRLEDAQRARMEKRQAIASKVLKGLAFKSHPLAFHVWLSMPSDWTSEVFASEARHRGVGVAPASFFKVAPGASEDAVRICLSAAKDDETLRAGLTCLASLLRGGNPWTARTAII